MSDEKLIPELSRDEALVFFDWLSRFNKAQDVSFNDQAEQRVLWDRDAMLEPKLVEPSEPNYPDPLAQARSAVRDSEE